MALVRDASYYFNEREANSLPLADVTTVYRHAALGITAGRVAPLTSGKTFAGFAGRGVSSAGQATGAPPLMVPIIAAGQVDLPVSGVADSDVGGSVYASDDSTFGTGGGVYIGRIVKVVASGVARVAFDALAAASVQGDGIPSSQLLKARLDAGQCMPMDVYGNSLVAAGGNPPYSTSWGTYENLAAASGGLLFLADNSGVPGTNSTEVLAKIRAEGINAPVVGIMEGTNDEAENTMAAHMANMRDIAREVLARSYGGIGGMPILEATPPKSGAPAATVSAYAIREAILAERMGIAYVDKWRRWVDPATGGWTAGAADVDGTHPTTAVYTQAGLDYWTQLRAARVEILPRRNAGNGLMANVLNLTDTGGDGSPDGWTANGLASISWSAMTDYAYPRIGKRATFSWSQTTGGNLYRSAAVTALRRYRLTGVIAAASLTNCTVYVRARCSGGVVTDFWALKNSAANFDDTYITLDFVAPVGTTTCQILIGMTPISGTASGSISFGCIDLLDYMLDQPDL